MTEDKSKRDPLEKFMVDKIEKTQREKELDTEIDNISNRIKEQNVKKNKLLKEVPKISEDKSQELKKEREILLKLLRENKKKQEQEKLEIRKNRLLLTRLINETLEMKMLRKRISEFEEKKEKLFEEYRKEVKKREVLKGGKIIKNESKKIDS